MKSTLKLTVLALFMLFTVEKPLQAAIDPLTVGTIIAGGTALGGILGYLSSPRHSSSDEKSRDVVEGCAQGFFMSLLASALMIEVYKPRVYPSYIPAPIYRPARRIRTTTYTTYPTRSYSYTVRNPWLWS